MAPFNLVMFIVLTSLNCFLCLVTPTDILNEIESNENISRSCSFESVFAEFYDTQGTSYESVINGCLTNTSFVVKDVTHIEISLQYIPRLERRSIGDLPELESILFIKSGIEHVEPGAFYNLPKIKNISFVFNDFHEVKRGIFNDLPANKILISSPVLTNIEEYAFADMNNLSTIAIHYSRILTWNRKWYGESKTLTTIDFRFGILEALPADAFHGFPNLKCISFRNNRLHTIENGIFQPVADVYLWGNPWTCSCLDSIKEWLRNTNGSIHDNYNCIDFRNPVCVATKSSVCLEELNHEATKTFFRKFSQKRLCVVPVTLL
ncbi:protein artichoke-like [Agrilus planipennis]|uniref:Protein artichoke-like n=1 Tax=Agrilus planipennis TaxID=224129 RepID=A0A1W4XAV2_AGRPL|nr:protein artichoke-like [Agrilus planipennis]